jgi:hypothetical protein
VARNLSAANGRGSSPNKAIKRLISRMRRYRLKEDRVFTRVDYIAKKAMITRIITGQYGMYTYFYCDAYIHTTSSLIYNVVITPILEVQYGFCIIR